MTETGASAAATPPNHARNRTIWWATYVLVAISIICFALWLFHYRFHEWTDDAYANGNLTNINSSVPGAVIAFYADDTDLVTEGQLLVELDSTEYKAVYERELATLAATVLQVKQLYDTVKVDKENVRAQIIEVSRTRFLYKNRLEIEGTGAVSEEDYVTARDNYFSARVALKQAKYQLKVARDAAGNTTRAKHPLIEQQMGNVRAAFYNLSHCSIYAPATGYIAQRAVNVGMWATPTLNLMAIIPTDYVWVDANFKETQLTYMRIGQPAIVELDIYGSRVKYRGKVIGIASGTGSVFSIIPPQNATGNWIKIVQRLPVRISLDPEMVKKYPTRLGLSAEVDVDITDQELPMLAPVPATKPVGKTDVYDIHLEELDRLMAKIVAENLRNVRP